MKTSTRNVVLAALTAAAMGLGALGWSAWPSHSGAPAGAPPGEGSSSPAAREGTAPLLPLRTWKEGDSFVYELHTTRGLVIHGQDGAEQTLQYKVTGTLALTVLSQDPDEVHLRADVRPTSVEVVPETPEDAARLASGTIYLRARRKGDILEFLFPGEVPPQARTLLRGIVGSFQMVVSSEPASAWQALEADVSGQYTASYRATGGGTLEKSKLRYLRTRGPAGFLPIPQGTTYAVESAATFGVDASGWPATLTEDETLVVSALGTQVSGRVQTTARLTGVESRPDQIGPFPPGLESETASEAAARALAMKQADLQMVGGRSFADIAAGLESPDSKARNQSQARMAALFRVSPDESGKVTEEVLRGHGDSISKKRMIGALGTGGTPEAQSELVRLLRAPEAGDLRVQAAVALSLTKHPTPETAAALKDAAESAGGDVSSTALLAAGNVVRTMNAEHTGDTTDLVQMLIDGLAGASSDTERQLYLKALGNTGDPRAFDAILPHLASSTVPVRATATGALRFMLGAAADEALARAMSDIESSVRHAAVSTLPFRPIAGVLEPVGALLKAEPEQAIRMAILQGMSTKLDEEDAVIDSVKWAMEHDPSSTVQGFAKQIVFGEHPEEP